MSKDLNTSRTQALQGLLRSLGHADDVTSSPTSLSTEQLQKLSEKFNEILGDVKDHNLKLGDEPSQLLSEDGLPVIDISEPVDEDIQTNASSPVPEQDLIPLSLLPPAERERRRQERDRILDFLEEEERLQQLQEERDVEEERKEAIRRRKESAKAELQQLRAAQELQKKMGRALVRHAKETRDSVHDDADSKHRTSPSSAATKSVSFSDALVVETDENGQQSPTRQPDLGDVTLGRLRAQGRVPLVGAAEAQEYPMKMRVVERHPVVAPTSSSDDYADSDDESTSSAPHLSPRLESDSSNEEDKSSFSNDTLSDDAPMEEGLDYTMAHHHREIALEYHKKRHAIGAEAAKAMATHVLGNDDQQIIPKGQTPLSRFRADRMAAAYDKSHGSVSMSIGQNVIPASRQKSLQNSVRLGKLENDQLVGGESGESGSEGETRDVIGLLRSGNIQNLGPSFDPSQNTPPGNPDVVESTATSIITHGAKLSKFKLARGAVTTSEGRVVRNNVQSHSAISNVVERKAPRSSPGQHFPVNKASLRPRGIPEQPPPMAIDSPSFPSSPALMATSPSSLHQQRPVAKFVGERRKLVE